MPALIKCPHCGRVQSLSMEQAAQVARRLVEVLCVVCNKPLREKQS